MAQWRDFAPSSEPETCWWCGEKLRWKMTNAVSRSEALALAVADKKIPTQNMYDKPGDYGDGYFCGLRCGYMFGVAQAGHGRRLMK